ncbi:MAG: SpoIID/LytB domain-containing protein [Myxococcota bacterium]
MRARRSSRFRSRRPSALRGLVAAAFALALALGLGPRAARAASDPVVRVLVVESSGTVELRGPAGRHRIERARRGDGLVVDRRVVGSSWAAAGEGPWEVAGRRYRGRLLVHATSDGLQVVDHVELEDYVAATVGGEMPASWPAEALRAQAVASRTYALHQRERRTADRWDLRATEQSQVYRGLEAETDPTRRAAEATRGEILTHHGRPILAAFHSTSGGRTASASEVWGEPVPYLDSIEVEHEEDAPFTYWRTLYPPADLDQLLDAMGAGLGSLHALEVESRTESGRVARLVASGSARRIVIRGDPLRTFAESLGLRSMLFDVRETPEGFAFVGSGFGHGVGMSQWGARELARRGASYRRILARFYPGAQLETWGAESIASHGGAEAQGR